MYRLHNMKQLTIVNITLGVIAFLLASCTDETMLNSSDGDQELQTYTLYLDADVPSFESGHEGETRASGKSWEDGDEIYVSFSNWGTTVICNAIYKSSLEAFQFSSVALNAIYDASCSVYYFRGGTISKDGNKVNLDKYTAIFCDTNAQYTCLNNTITLSAVLKPHSWRLCFKGEKNTRVKLESSSSILFNSSIDLTNGSFTTISENVNLQVQSSGFTPYIYGVFSDLGNTMIIEVGEVCFFRTISSSKLKIGESGYFNIPNSSNPQDWLMIHSNGHDFIDLGLPSGTLWATCNIGASIPEEYGESFAWGETEVKDYYEWDTYKYCDNYINTCYDIGDDISGTEYDVAHKKWGGSWRMPTLDQINELLDNCGGCIERINGIEGINYVGPNGASIFLPNNPWTSSYGKYWTSTIFNHAKSYAYAWDNNSFFIDRCTGYPVRAVCNSNPHFSLSQYRIYTTVGQNETVDIICGSGNYSISNDEPNVALAHIKGSTIILEALHTGNAIITVDDLELNMKNKIRVEVINRANPNYPIAEAIDLGLPSGTKWASWNVGASAPEEIGGSYAWGETEDKAFFDWSTYLYYEGIDSECINIGNNISNTIYDVATAKWGEPWRMPSSSQFRELRDYCIRTWTTQNDVEGYLFTGPNGASFFLPYETYWSSNLSSYPDCALSLFFTDEKWSHTRVNSRCYGLCVRAVCQ